MERDEWNRRTCQGVLSLPKWESQIEVRLNNDSEASLFSVELVDVKDREIIAQRIRQFRSDTRWLKDRTYGIFFQWRFWGYPKEGEPKSNWKDVYRDFNIERCANLMEEMGAGWGINKRNRTIKKPEFTLQEWIDYLGRLQEAGAGISPAVLMYEDGEMHPVTYQLFVHARRKFRGISDKDLITKRRNRGDKPVANSYVWSE